MVSNRWIKHAIKQTKKAIESANKQYYCISTSRDECVVCQYMKKTHKIAADNPYDNSCENSKGMKCPARDMCLEFVESRRLQIYRKPLIKRLEKHLQKLNNLLEESQ